MLVLDVRDMTLVHVESPTQISALAIMSLGKELVSLISSTRSLLLTPLQSHSAFPNTPPLAVENCVLGTVVKLPLASGTARPTEPIIMLPVQVPVIGVVACARATIGAAR